MMMSLFKVFWVLALFCKAESERVSLELTHLPVVFGESATLFCNLSAILDCCSNKVTWMRNLNVIVHHGSSVNSSKYVQSSSYQGFFLQIEHFEEDDLYVKYSCLYDFLTVSKVLELDENEFEKHPNIFDISLLKRDQYHQELFTVSLNLGEVYPMPMFRILIDEHESKTQITTRRQLIGMFYNASAQFNLSYSDVDCRQNITVVCSVGKYIVKRSLEHLTQCSSDNSVDTHRNDITTVGIIIALAVIIAVGTASAYIYRRRKTYSRLKNSHYLKLKTLAKKISTETTLKTEKDKAIERTNYEIEQRRKDLAMDGQYNDKTISKTLPSMNSISKDPEILNREGYSGVKKDKSCSHPAQKDKDVRAIVTKTAMNRVPIIIMDLLKDHKTK